MAPGIKSWFKLFLNHLSDICIRSREEIFSERIHKAFSEYDYEKLSELIEKFGTPDVPNKAGETPLELAAINGASSERAGEMVKFLIEKGANVLKQDKDGKITAAAYMVQYEDQNLIDLVLSKIEDINSPLDIYKSTALHMAVKIFNETTVLKLLKMGANPNQRNTQRRTAMHEAVTPKGCDLLKLLVSYGGDINLSANHEYTPLHLAILSEIDLVSSSGKTLAGDSNERRPGSILEKVLELRPYMNARDKISNTALGIFMLRSRVVHEDVVNKLIDAGTNPSLRDQTGMNVLHRLVQRNICRDPQKLVKKLINRGVDIDAYTYFNEDTALHIAAAFGHTEYVYLLLTLNANLFAQNIRGRTPMDMAIFAENYETIEVIYSFIISRNLPMEKLMMDYHKTKDNYEIIVTINNRAQEEYRRCKSMRMYSPWNISYSDILFMSEKKFAKLLKNRILLANFTANLVDLKAFRYSFNKLYRAAKIRRDAEDAAVMHLLEIWNYKLIPECIEIIVDFMETDELTVYLNESVSPSEFIKV